MVPDFLSNKYLQYKEDTNKFITWLLDTAKKYGHTESNPLPKSTPITARLKGRARKDAQKAASMPNRKKTEVRGKVSLQDIAHLARTIVTNIDRKNPVRVPQYVLKHARNAIDARRKFIEWFQTQAVDQPALQENNKRHAYFVQVLEEALNTLTPYVTASLKETAVPVQSTSSKTAEVGGKTLNNLFENLEMYDPEDQDLLGAAVIDVQDVGTAQDAQQTQEKELYELEGSEAETQFAIFCVLQDVHCIQDFVIETWQHYKSGEIDLVTASITTNTAINFVHDAEEQLMVSYPQLTDYLKILEAFYPSTKALRPRIEHEPGRPDAHSSSAASGYSSTLTDFAIGSDHDFDEAEYLYTRPYILLYIFRNQVRASPSEVFVSSKEARGDVYDPLADRSQMCLGEKDKEDSYVLRHVLPEVLLLTQLVVPAEDEFSQGIRQVLSGDVIPLWVVFAYQIYLDIHRTLRDQVARGLEELRVAKTQMKATLKDYFENEKSMLDCGWSKDGAHLLRELDEILEEWIEEDAFSKMKEKMYSRPLTGPLDRPYYLLSQHPLLCGTLLLDIRLRLQDPGIIMVNGWGSILCGAHLYNAARKEGYLPMAWPDVEAFIAIHSPELIFVGKAPSSSDDYFKRFCLAAGMTAAVLGRGQRHSKQLQSKNGSRKIGVESPISKLLKSLHHLTPEVEIDVHIVSKMLTNVSQKAKRNSALTSPLFNQWNQTHKLTKVQLLAIVRQSLANEQPMLHFDYAAMHHRCRHLFTRIRSELGAELPDLEGTDTSSEMTLPTTLTVILYQLMEGNPAGNALLLIKACDILKDVVEREGEEEMRKMHLKGKRHGWVVGGI